MKVDSIFEFKRRTDRKMPEALLGGWRKLSQVVQTFSLPSQTSSLPWAFFFFFFFTTSSDNLGYSERPCKSTRDFHVIGGQKQKSVSPPKMDLPPLRTETKLLSMKMFLSYYLLSY